MEWSSKKELNSINAQIDIMKTANHEFVISLFEYFKSPKCVWLIMELTNSVPLRGILEGLKTDSNNLESFITQSIIQILQGIEYLHSMGIVHRSLNIDNIFYQGDISTGKIKISNFELSAMIKSGTKDFNSKNYTDLTERLGKGTFLYCILYTYIYYFYVHHCYCRYSYHFYNH
jgi:serine/threonine protein kinase